MAYLVDRQRAFRAAEIVVICGVSRHGARSCVVLRDGSRHYTLTRPRTFAAWADTGRPLFGLGVDVKQG